MIKKRNLNTGVNANVSLEPSSASQSNNNINNNIIINRREDGKEDIVITRDVTLNEESVNDVNGFSDRRSACRLRTNVLPDVRTLILETYAKILLDQDKALISNLISKRTIIIPQADLTNIIKTVTGGEAEILTDDNDGCCAARASPIQKIDAIKIYTDSGEIVTDFKQVYNKEYNELVNTYHLNLKYCVC